VRRSRWLLATGAVALVAAVAAVWLIVVPDRGAPPPTTAGALPPEQPPPSGPLRPKLDLPGFDDPAPTGPLPGRRLRPSEIAAIGTTVHYDNGLEVSVSRLGLVTAEGGDPDAHAGDTLLVAEIMVGNRSGGPLWDPTVSVRARVGASQYPPARVTSDKAIERLSLASYEENDPAQDALKLDADVTATYLEVWVLDHGRADAEQVSIQLEPLLETPASLPVASFEGGV
jgi:hypothetical protein